MKNAIGFAISVIGYSHILKNKPCQDYSCYYSDSRVSVGIVCDGHGGDKHFRSATGARIATNIVCDAAVVFAKSVSKDMVFAERLKKLRELEKNIIYTWQIKVKEDITQFPFTDDEIDGLSEREKKQLTKNAFLAYGTTLLCVIKVKEYCYLLKLGDGNIVCISDDKMFEPIEKDRRLNFNYTTSLCAEDAFDCMQDAVMKSEKIKAFILSSDGVYNSFDGREKYYNFLNQIYSNREDKDILQETTEFLPILSKNGSGDDLSICLLQVSSM